MLLPLLSLPLLLLPLPLLLLLATLAPTIIYTLDELGATCCPKSNSLVSLPRSSLDQLLKTTSPNLLLSRRYFLVPLPVLMLQHQGHIRDVSTLSQYSSTPVLISSHSSTTLKISSLTWLLLSFIPPWPLMPILSFRPLWPLRPFMTDP